MPKTKISEFSATPGNNTDIDGINIAEGCSPSGINDAIRELMSQLKDFQAGTAGDSFNGPVGTTTAAAGAFTNLSASGTFALTGDQVQISEGGTGQTTANAAFNALAPSQSTHAGKYLKTDGTNTSWDALDISTADITGTLPVANGGTGVTSSTGTGSVVLSASPTFTGTVSGASLTLSSNFTLSGGTANGVAYLNGSKVLTTGSALVFDGSNLGLGVTPSAWNAAIRSLQIGVLGGTVITANTSAGGTSSFGQNFYFDTDFRYAATGNATRYSQINGQHQWFAAASGTAGNTISFTQSMTLDGSGNLGVGITSPTSKLHVSGTGTVIQKLASTSGAVELQLIANTQANASYSNIYSGDGTNWNWRIGGSDGTSNTMTFSTGGSERARIDSSGNLGLGVTPSAWVAYKALQVASLGGAFSSSSSSDLEITTNAYYSGGWLSQGAGVAASRYRLLSGTHSWWTSTTNPGAAGNAISFTQAMTLDDVGRLNIGGTSSPGAYRLALTGDSANYMGGIVFRQISTDTLYLGNIGATNTTDVEMWNPRNGYLRFATNNTERARITSGGQVLINTTTDGAAAGGRLHITGNTVQSAASIRIGTDGYPGWYFTNSAGTKVGDIVINNASTTYNTTSDYRLKNITGPVTNSGAYIDSLKPVEGTWKSNGSIFVGLIAHEAQEVSRTQVATGTKDGEELQGMDYSNSEFIANIIAELQSLRARVAALEGASA